MKDCHLMVREILQNPLRIQKKIQKIKMALTSKHLWNLKGTKGLNWRLETETDLDQQQVCSFEELNLLARK